MIKKIISIFIITTYILTLYGMDEPAAAITHQCVKNVIEKYKEFKEFDKKQYKHLMKISLQITKIMSASPNAPQINKRMHLLLFRSYPSKTDYVVVLEQLCNAWKTIDEESE